MFSRVSQYWFVKFVKSVLSCVLCVVCVFCEWWWSVWLSQARPGSVALSYPVSVAAPWRQPRLLTDCVGGCWLLTVLVAADCSGSAHLAAISLTKYQLTIIDNRNIYSPKLRHFWSTSLLKIQELTLMVVVVVVGSLVNKLGDFNADVICLERLGGCNV